MDNLKRFVEDLQIELKDSKMDKDVEEDEKDKEDEKGGKIVDSEETKENEKKGNSKVRIETTTKITGIVRNLYYDVNFDNLKSEINDNVKGIVVNKAKAKQIFKIVKKIMGF